MFYYIWNGFLLIICIVLPIILMAASNGARPTWMSCQEMRRKACHCAGCERERKQLGGYQPCAKNCHGKIAPPPKNR